MKIVIAIIGKVGSGKTYYAKKIMEKSKAVLLSNDEIIHDLYCDEYPLSRFEFALKVNNYLLKKAVEIVNAGSNVILDWGFWKKEERTQISDYFKCNNIGAEWHYIDIDDDTWNSNIKKRNKEVMEHDDGSSFYLSNEIINLVNMQFEVPCEDEVDVWYKSKK